MLRQQLYSFASSEDEKEREVVHFLCRTEASEKAKGLHTDKAKEVGEKTSEPRGAKDTSKGELFAALIIRMAAL